MLCLSVVMSLASNVNTLDACINNYFAVKTLTVLCRLRALARINFTPYILIILFTLVLPPHTLYSWRWNDRRDWRLAQSARSACWRRICAAHIQIDRLLYFKRWLDNQSMLAIAANVFVLHFFGARLTRVATLWPFFVLPYCLCRLLSSFKTATVSNRLLCAMVLSN